MDMLLLILALAAGVTSLACWVITLVKLFQNGDTVLGCVSICGIVGFIVGWMKSDELDNKGVMLIWSLALLVSIGFRIAARMN